MNDDIRLMTEELEEFLHRGCKLLKKMKGQSMGQRHGGGYGRMGYRDDRERYDNGSDMGERNWFGMGGYDPRL